MIKEEVTIDDYITFYEGIPAENWCTGQFRDEDGCCCAVGHLAYNDPSKRLSPPVLYSILKEAGYCEEQTSFPREIVEVNDGKRVQYKQPEVKQRVLCFLNDVKEKLKTVKNKN